MPHSDRASPNCDGWLRQRRRKDSKLGSDSARFLEGKERDVFHSAAPEPRREQNMQLEQQYTVKWSLLELMSALSVRTLKCSLTRACSSSANTSHRIILSPVFSSPWQGEERLIWASGGQKNPNKALAQRERLQHFKKLDQDTRLFGSSATSSHGCIAMKQYQKRFWRIYLNTCVCVLAEHKHGDDDNELWLNTNFRHLELLSLSSSPKFYQHKCQQLPQEGTAAKHFPLQHVLLLLLCGIPYSKLIKTRQLIAAADKREGNTLHRVHRFLNTYYLLDSFLIAKIFSQPNPPTGRATPPPHQKK